MNAGAVRSFIVLPTFKFKYYDFRCLSAFEIVSRPTVYALSSGYGKCGVAVIRVSGPKASEVIFNMTGMKTTPKPRLAKLCKMRDPMTKDILDRGLVLWFPGPNSFTGEDICELHVHGGEAVISSILKALSKLSNFKPAEPGDFTRRAFHSGKLDLTEVEGLADLLSAETEEQRKQAYMQMEGALSGLYNGWRQILLRCVAHIEAFIDFSEDENIEENVMFDVNSKLQTLEKDIEDHILHSKCGERLREGVRTVIIGKPNVGKSSLLNLLCQRPAAIVTPVAGTTRDVLEIHMNVGGYPVLLADTAGLHSATKDEIEMEGMSRAISYANMAEIIMCVVDVEDCVHKIATKQVLSFEKYIYNYVLSFGINEFNTSLINYSILSEQVDTKCNSMSKCLIIVLNKSDLIDNHSDFWKSTLHYNNIVSLSCKSGKGLDELHANLIHNLTKLCGNPSKERPNFTQARHRHHLTSCLQCLSDYFILIEANSELALAAQKLRNALRHIGKITGHVSTESILDVIFKDFCIGK